MHVPYVYRATVLRVVDGDTVDLQIDVGFKLTTVQRCRLLGINAPEMKGETKPAGEAAKTFLMVALAGNTLYIRTEKSDVFGRYLADITAVSPSGVEMNVNQAMLDSGHAVVFMG